MEALDVHRIRTDHSLVFCAEFVMQAQNGDGGWGYQPNLESCVEPTCWALLALTGTERVSGRAIEWLCGAQLPDGSWPAYPGQSQGSWTTALCCLALDRCGVARERVERGVQWLLSTWPADYGLWWRLRTWRARRSHTLQQNCSFAGWSWTPNAASWVEPTSCAVIALRNFSGNLPFAAAARRIALAQGMLLDRMCPGGGWNIGNPMVYGVAGEPRVGPTAWALLALQNTCDAALLESSLDWLDRACTHLRTPWSLALGSIALTQYNRCTAAVRAALKSVALRSDLLWNVPAAAMVSIAVVGTGRRPVPTTVPQDLA